MKFPHFNFNEFMHLQPPTSGLICSIDGDGGDDGDGGGSGSAFSSDQREELTKIINGAQTTHVARQEKRFDAKLDEMQTGITGAMAEGFAKFDKKDDPPGGTAKPPDKKVGETEAMAQMRQEHEARMKEMDNKFEAEKALRVEEANVSKIKDERNKLSAALSAANVPKGLIKGAAAQLYIEEEKISRNKEGQVIYKAQREGYVDELSLQAGIAEWLATEEGKYYAPPRGGAGSGAIGGGTPRTQNGKMSKEQRKKQAKHELMHAIINENH